MTNYYIYMNEFWAWWQDFMGHWKPDPTLPPSAHRELFEAMQPSPQCMETGHQYEMSFAAMCEDSESEEIEADPMTSDEEEALVRQTLIDLKREKGLPSYSTFLRALRPQVQRCEATRKALSLSLPNSCIPTGQNWPGPPGPCGQGRVREDSQTQVLEIVGDRAPQ